MAAAECIIPTQDCIERHNQGVPQDVDEVCEHFQGLQLQEAEAIQRIEEQLHKIKLQMKSGSSE